MDDPIARLAFLTSSSLLLAWCLSVQIREAGEARTRAATVRVSLHLAPELRPWAEDRVISSLPHGRAILRAARAHSIDPALLAGLVSAESDFDRHAESHRGARGLGQLLPSTAREYRFFRPGDLFVADLNLDISAAHFRFLLDTLAGDEQLALAAYNSGLGAVGRYQGIPPYPETQAYVRRVTRRTDGYRAEIREILGGSKISP